MIRSLTGRRGFARHTFWLRQTVILAMLALMALLHGATESQAAPTAPKWPLIRLEQVAQNFTFPVNLIIAKDGTNRLFVLERSGVIHVVENGVRQETPFLDISNRVNSSCGECGLLGLAFPPDFAESGYFFVNYTSNGNLVPGDTGDPDPTPGNDTVIARYHITSNPNVADPSREDRILVINQPAANHNGGHILFGPDGYLYIGMGDGGGGNDQYENAQNPQSLLGKILRIEVGATGTYTIPEDNPFVDDDAYRDEIWAMGVRNPWRFSFDPTSGDFYVADVGQESTEEVNHIPAGEIGNGGMNFGWPIMEGNVCFPPGGSQDCDRTDLILPVATYSHDDVQPCASITGGHVYHSSLPNQAPVYLFGDYCSGQLWGLQRDGDTWASAELEDYPFHITSFAQDDALNVYILSYEGTIYRVTGPANAQFLPSVAKELLAGE